MYLKLDESKWYRHTQEWSDRTKGTGKVEVYKGQIEVVEDVAPVVHAHWVEDDDGVHCSECKKDAPLEVFTYSFHPETDSWDGDVKFNKSEFCPSCGAKMDEVVK